MNVVRSFAISQSMGIKRKIERLVFFFRFEEFVARLFLAPATYFTFKAFFFFQAQGDVPRRFSGGVVRLIVVLAVLAIAWIIAQYKPQWRLLRDGLPLAMRLPSMPTCMTLFTLSIPTMCTTF